MKKCIALAILLAAVLCCHARTRFYWDFGDAGLTFTFNRDLDFETYIQVGDMYWVDGNTGLYLSCSPFSCYFPKESIFIPDDMDAPPVDQMYLVNVSAGKLLDLGYGFCAEAFVRGCVLDPLDIRSCRAYAGLRLSFIPVINDFAYTAVSFFGRIASLEGGVYFPLKDMSSPVGYWTLSINLGILMGGV